MPKTLPTTKHYQLASNLRRQIRGMSTGQAIPTVSELKQRFSVSQATVERALDRLRREGLVERRPGELRLVVAAAADPAAHRVAIIRPDYPSPTFEALARSVVQTGRQRDWAFDLVTYRRMDALDLRRAIGQNDAAVLLPTSEPFPEHLLAALRRPRRPVIVIQDPPSGLRVSSVRIDDREVGRLAVEHLASLGHRRILLVLSEPAAPSGVDRAAGWRDVMEGVGVNHLDELVVNCDIKPFEPSMHGSYRYFSHWLDQPHPAFTAVFCAAWTGAMAVMRALREHGIDVPRQVSVATHGGEEDIASFINPPLTAVESDMAGYGRLIIDQLERELTTGLPTEPADLVVKSELVIRASTAPCPAP